MLKLLEIQPKEKRYVIEYNGTKDQALEIIEKYDSNILETYTKNLYLTATGKYFFFDSGKSGGEFIIKKGYFIEVDDSVVVNMYTKEEFKEQFDIIA